MDTYTVTVLADGSTIDEPFEVRANNLTHALIRAAHKQEYAQLLLAGDEINVALNLDAS
jgi:hypothetical protein